MRSVADVFLRAVRRALRAWLSTVNHALAALDRRTVQAPQPTDEVRAFLLSLDQRNAEAADYLRIHAERLATTVVLAPPAASSARCLELGSYMQLAPALKEFKGYTDIRVAGLGTPGAKVRKIARAGGRVVLECDLDLFDAERDPFPYPENSFELVLACELIEHLRVDPMHMLFEIHRVLMDGGRLLITTPNCASFASLEQCLWQSANPYTYSLYPNPQKPERDGAATHIREYTPDELKKVVECAGFEVEILTTRRGRPVERQDVIEDALMAYGFPTDLRGEQIYCLARKVRGTERVRYPRFLYD